MFIDIDNYTRIKIGIDAYAMEESGTTAGGAFTQTVNGEDEYTLQDTGNLGTGNYARSITGEGTYDRVTTGPGATMPTDSGTINFLWEQIGDPHNGTFSLTQTGDDRYDLLEAFKDVSNTQAGQTPGHMNVYPVGQTFVDPFVPDRGQLPSPYDGQIADTLQQLAANEARYNLLLVELRGILLLQSAASLGQAAINLPGVGSAMNARIPLTSIVLPGALGAAPGTVQRMIDANTRAVGATFAEQTRLNGRLFRLEDERADYLRIPRPDRGQPGIQLLPPELIP